MKVMKCAPSNIELLHEQVASKLRLQRVQKSNDNRQEFHSGPYELYCDFRDFTCYKYEGNYRHQGAGKSQKHCFSIAMAGVYSDNSVNEPYNDEQPHYVPSELVNVSSNSCHIMYHCYLIELKQNFSCDASVHDIVLAIRSELDSEIGCIQFEMIADMGRLGVKLKYIGVLLLSSNEDFLCRKFQITLFRILLNRKNKLASVFDELCLGDHLEIDYLLLPATTVDQRGEIIDWKTINSVSCPSEKMCEDHAECVWTKNGLVCTCKLENSLVCTPHNGLIYIITATMELNGNSPLGKTGPTYKKYFQKRHSIELRYEHQPLLKARHVFDVQNCLLGCRQKKTKEPNSYVELPPELCSIIMAPISINTIYSFSFLPSIMHRIESLLLAFNLKKMHLDHCTGNDISTVKVLEAITAAGCQESFDYESLETIGDSFLKYAVSQQLFKTYQNHREGLLSKMREITSNDALSKFGCSRKLPGFIRNGRFNPKSWIIPGDKSGMLSLKEELVSCPTKIYVAVGEKRKVNFKIVADVVEALIGVFLKTGGETAALSFINWIGIAVNFDAAPYGRHLNIQPEELVNVSLLQSLLNYSFHDVSLLVEAVTHGSYMRPETRRSYQQLEFLGDAVLDYLVTMHFCNKYPDASEKLLTDMRSDSVNNECYERCTIRAELHKYILASPEMQKQIALRINDIGKSSSESTSEWKSETSLCKVLADVIESLAGAIFIDSGYNKDVVFQSIRPLLEPLVTPDTVTLQSVRELNELCDKLKFHKKEPVVSSGNGETSFTIKVEANGIMHEYTATAPNKKTAEKSAAEGVLNCLKS